jgi:acetyl esterase/lipase
MTRSAALACAFVLSSVVLAAQVRVSDKVVSEDRYPPRQTMFSGGVMGLADLTYSTIPGYRRLTLDLYLPPGPTANAHPTVVYLHGGGWSGGTPRNAGAFENWPEVLASIAARGYVVASIEYRFAREAPFPAALHDVKNALRWLRANAAAYGIDPQRMVVWGSSAGGQLAGLAATTCGVSALDPPVISGRGSATAGAKPPSDCVQGAVLWYAASDLAMSAAGGRAGAPNQYLGCTPPNCAEQAKAASVNTYVDASDPPMLLIHGAADATVPVAQSQSLYSALQAKGVRSELLVLPDIDHSYLGKTPEATRDASRKGLEKTIAFIDAIIGPGSRSASERK